MSLDEKKQVIEFTVNKVNKRIPVIAGTGGNNTKEVISLSKFAESVGCNGLLIVTPYYNKTTQRGLVASFNTIVDAAGLPAILYNVPSRTGVNIESATAKELAKNPLICGIKEASGNISQIAMTAALCGDELPLYSGNDDQVVPILALGGKGVISVVSNVAPEPMHRLCQLWFEGKTKESLDLQLQLMGLCKAMFCEVNPIPVKTALHLMGYCQDILRLPLCPLSPAHRLLLEETLAEYGLI